MIRANCRETRGCNNYRVSALQTTVISHAVTCNVGPMGCPKTVQFTHADPLFGKVQKHVPNLKPITSSSTQKSNYGQVDCLGIGLGR